jgi:hypothetical protein
MHAVSFELFEMASTKHEKPQPNRLVIDTRLEIENGRALGRWPVAEFRK